ncbi:MAG: hypothetical protein H7Y38_04945 [Armatimonadetes bacterium]|nr:hypothetical protein [Armatimonadota bacterium]
MSDEPIQYAVRYSARARRDFDQAVSDYDDYTGDSRRAVQLYEKIDNVATGVAGSLRGRRTRVGYAGILRAACSGAIVAGE